MSMNSRDKANAGRVKITYDVETGDALVKRELPFVVGVIGDFAGDTKLAPLAERRFADIDRKNFETVMEKMAPSLSLRVDDPKSSAASGAKPAETETNVKLVFKSMADFEPARIADQVPEIKMLKEMRIRLRELLTRANRSEDLAELLRQILTDRTKLDALSSELKKVEEKK